MLAIALCATFTLTGFTTNMLYYEPEDLLDDYGVARWVRYRPT